jgi:hypothetical protein
VWDGSVLVPVQESWRLNDLDELHGYGCKSWRGCDPKPRRLSASEVRFECGGNEQAQKCVSAVQKCTKAADEDANTLYKTQPKVATELRGEHNCKCFVSNGCSPSCNVAIYMIWSASKGMRCKSEPPVYLESSGAYLYGDPYSGNALSSDVSFDYFPDFPNPSGHIMNVPDVRTRYAEDPKTHYEYPMYPRTARYSSYEPLTVTSSAAGRGGAWTPFDSPAAPSSASDPWGFWEQHNINDRPYNSWTGEGKYYAPFAEAYYYYDPSSKSVYLQ